ncbi:MAG TPA: alpha/beta fold hydrolase [Solirubrobacteraceae bacterium]
MRRRAPLSAYAALIACIALAGLPADSPAASGLNFVACANSQAFQCSALAVPLDRGGKLPGSVPLSLQRRLAGPQPSRDAVVALAGGPGQATLPLGEFIAQAIAPALSSRDLLIFDQRGTGSSDPLSCSALEELTVTQTVGRIFEQCALDIGPARADFTTAESVQDIEALRVAGGYEKLVLYGTSYGTKVALEYAARYPQRVESLVLDSVVPIDGPEPLEVPTFQAIAPMFAELCGSRACSGITANPLADTARLAARLHHRRLSGSVYDGVGRRHATTLDEVGLLGILEAGDLNPALRALLPAAVQSALRGDPDPLLRLHLLSEGLIPNVPSVHAAATSEAPEVDEALFATTSCEETLFPWQRGASSTTRLGEALNALHAQPRGIFYPFDTTTAFNNGLIPGCVQSPVASAPPAAAGPLPNVPTLILSGGQDLRTPTSNARLVAASIPDAQIEVVPFTGHSVIGSDLSGCASAALSAFFSTGTVAPCGASVNKFSPTPITPTRVRSVRAPSALRGRPGQTLVAVLDTLIDLNRQVISATLQANQELPAGASFGGLRGGYARLTSSAVVLRHFTFVPGVELNGSFPVKKGELQAGTIRVFGREGSSGVVRIGTGFKKATGTLGGRHFSLLIARVRLADAGAGSWPARAAIRPLLGRGDAGAGIARARAPRLP